jgi:hypothetical protein
VSSFEFFSITSQEGLTTSDGIIGLSPQISGASSYTTALFNAGVIPEKVLGYLVAGESYQSQVMFGGYNSNLMTSTLNYQPLIGTDWW